MARPLQTLAPAFVHVDVDDMWAIAECYGIPVADELAHAISTDALPRFEELFRAHGVRATFFVVGRDLESPGYTELIRDLLARGHAVANHSFTHRLDFRALTTQEIHDEITRTHDQAQSTLGINMQGFRAPGYAASSRLTYVLQQLAYRYDASLMPSPYGVVFRAMDARLQKKAMPEIPSAGERQLATPPNRKTQYPLLRDAWHSLRPTPLPPIPLKQPAVPTPLQSQSPLPGNPPTSSLIQLPSATSPLLRLPFQAGVCMRLGWPYFRACFEPYRRTPHLPFVFLFHAADLADFSQIPIPFFQNSAFFGTAITHRLSFAERFLQAISQSRQIITTEEWLG